MLRSLVVITALVMAPAPAAAFDETPPPEDLAPLPLRLPASWNLAVAALLFVPANAHLAASSLGWRVEGLRWLSPRLGLALTFDRVELAKAAPMARDLGLALYRADLGMRLRSGTAPNLQLYGDLAVGYALVARRWHQRHHRDARASARANLGITGELAPYVYLAASVDYTITTGAMTMALSIGYSL